MESLPIRRERPKFPIGNPGKPKGAKTKATKTIREAFVKVFNDAQESPALAKYSLYALLKKDIRTFYMLASKLIPIEVHNNITKDITIRVMPLEIEQPKEDAITDIPHEIIQETD